ncbi:MAG: hypothetical protein AAGI38_17390 [Bacteroidota bacterium]
MKTLNFFLILLLLTGSFFVGCERLRLDKDTQSSIDNSFAESEFSAIQRTFDLEGQQDESVKKNNSGYFCACSQISVSEIADSTYQMVIDYGSGCTCLDGRTRAGKLTGIFYGQWKNDGSYVDITPENYRITLLNGEAYDFSFSKKISKLGPDSDGNPTFRTEVKNAVLTGDDGTVRWNSTRTTKWVEGVGDLNPSTNVYLVSGGATGTNRKGVDFEVEILEPLRIEMDCPNVTQGVLELTPDEKETRSLDYGDGTCDRRATFSVGNFTTEITLR